MFPVYNKIMQVAIHLKKSEYVVLLMRNQRFLSKNLLILSNNRNLGNMINGKRSSRLLTFLIFWFLTLTIYWSTYPAGFTTDFLGWAMQYRNGSFADILNCFGYPGNHQMLHFLFYSMYTIFDVNGIPWLILASFLHALNAYLSFILCKDIFERNQIAPAKHIAFFGALLFLLSPYHGEVLVWKACLHYLGVSCMILTILWNLNIYIHEEKKTIRLLWMHLAFAVGLFLLELSFITPVLSTLFILFSYPTMVKKRLTKIWLPVVGVQLVLFMLYLSLNIWSLGSIVGHYGAETHLKFDIRPIFANYIRYFLKTYIYTHFWSYSWKAAFYTNLSQAIILWPLVGLGTAAITVFVFYFKKLPARWRWLGGLLISYFAALGPIINLYFAYLYRYENNRYDYLALTFGSMVMALMIGSLPKRFQVRYIAAFCLLFVHLTFLFDSVKNYTESGDVVWGLIEDFRWETEDIVVLASPDNLNGVWIFRDFKDPALPLIESLELLGKKTYSGNMKVITQYNMTQKDDGVTAKVINQDSLNITFNQWGTWFQSKGIGASDFENERYKFRLIPGGYALKRKEKESSKVYIYNSGLKWKKIDID